MTDDEKTNEELVAIRDEIAKAPADKRKKLFEAYVDAAHNGMQVESPEALGDLIIEYLKQSEWRYPAMMTECNGKHEKAAGYVMGMMLAHAHDGVEVSIGEACEICEEVAALYITDLHRRARYDGRFRL